MKKAAKISGIGYLIIFITGIFSNFFVLEKLTNETDSEQILNNLVSNSELLLIGILGFALMVFFDALLAFTIHNLFKEVNYKLSLISSALRFVNATLFSFALFKLFHVYNLTSNVLSQEKLTNVVFQQQIGDLIEQFNNIWIIGLIFFGFHLLLLGFLIKASRFVPNVLGYLILIAGFGYLADSVANLMMNNYKQYKDLFALIVILPSVISEWSFTIWLLIKGFEKQSFRVQTV